LIGIDREGWGGGDFCSNISAVGGLSRSVGPILAIALTGSDDDARGKVRKAVTEQLASGNFPTATTVFRKTPIKEADRWRVYEGLEVKSRATRLLKEGEQLARAGKYEAAENRFGQVTNIPGDAKNEGDLTLSRVEVTVYFKDATGKTIHEESFVPVSVKSFRPDNRGPLRPGYIWEPERGTFYTAKTVPTEWRPGAAQARITDLDSWNRRGGSRSLWSRQPRTSMPLDPAHHHVDFPTTASRACQPLVPTRFCDMKKVSEEAINHETVGWGGRIRTSEWRNQNPLPYLLATPHQ
jgi:hypothetical protein